MGVVSGAYSGQFDPQGNRLLVTGTRKIYDLRMADIATENFWQEVDVGS
jgi:hypothetical protein